METAKVRRLGGQTTLKTLTQVQEDVFNKLCPAMTLLDLLEVSSHSETILRNPALM